MKRIMFYNRSFFGGGVEKALADLIVKLDPEKYDITVIVQDREGKYLPLYEEIEKTHSNIHIHQCFEHLTDGKNIFHKAYNVLTLKIAKWSMLRFPKLYYRLAIRGKWDVEISYMHNEAVKIIAGSSNKRSKKYTYVHTDISVHTGWTGYFKSQKERVKYYKKYDGIICVSDKVKNSVNKILGPFDNIQTIYNLVDRDNIIQKSKEPLGFEVDKSVSIICAVGRLSFEKNFEHLIKHFIKLKRGGDTLLIFG